MAQSWQSVLERWRDAGLIDSTTAERIHAYEQANGEPAQLGWPVRIAIGFGALMLGAGVLLFIAVHWDQMSPGARFTLVLVLVAIFHVAGAFASSRFPELAMALHGIGTIAAGAGIYLSAQIFNLQEHWPGGIMLWAAAAWIAWWILRDWVQAALAAMLTPAWLAAEWIDIAERHHASEKWAMQGLLLLALTYLSACYGAHRSPVRRVLMWIGGITLLPLAIYCAADFEWGIRGKIPAIAFLIGVPVAILGPIIMAWILREKEIWQLAVCAVWTTVASWLPTYPFRGGLAPRLAPYVWTAVGSIGLIAWGLSEDRAERINLGIVGFGLTILVFYFSSVMDKLDRSASLIGLGLLFLLLGWFLEKLRRRLVARVEGAA
jgi:uncharacterized membrane protein